MAEASKGTLGLSLAMAALLLLAGCGLLPGGPDRPDATARTAPESDEVFRAQLRGGVSDLDPATATDPGSLTVLGNVGEGLYRRDEDGEPVPGMAEGVEVSEDRLTYTFTLRGDARWSSGEPVTARDFEYAWLRAMDPDTASEQSQLLTDFIEGGAGFNARESGAGEVAVEATGEQTLRVRLQRPTPYFLDLTTLPVYMPLKRGFVEARGAEFAGDETSLLYNGPYALERLDAGGVRLEKRPGYWDAANVSVETVEARTIRGGAASRYESDELDVAALGPGGIPDYETEADFEQRTGFSTFSLYLNGEDPALRNRSLRRAVQAGLDRESFVDAVRDGGSVPAYGYVPYGMSSGGGAASETFRELAGDTVPGAGTVDARRHWERGVEELGREPVLTILASYEEGQREAADLLREQLEERLGTRVEVEVVPPETLLERAESGEYQILAATWEAHYDDPASYLDPRASGSEMNGLSLGDARYRDRVEAALTEPAGEGRARGLVRAERYLVEEGAFVAPVYHSGDSYLLDPAVRDYVTPPFGPPVDYRHLEIER